MTMVIPSAVEKSPTKQYATTRPWRTIATRHIKDFIKASFLVKGSLLKERLILSRRCRKGEARNGPCIASYSKGETLSASARIRCHGVFENKTSSRQSALVIKPYAGEIYRWLPVEEDTEPVEGEDRIPFLFFREVEDVAQPWAASALYPETEPGTLILILKKAFNLGFCAWCYGY